MVLAVHRHAGVRHSLPCSIRPGNWKGVLPGYEGGWTREKQWEREVSQADEKYGPIFAKYAAMSVEQVAQDPQAVKMGARLFANYCAICHGSDAKGSWASLNRRPALALGR